MHQIFQTVVTLACGLSVDFSEDNEATDELGDSPRTMEAEVPPPRSEEDDAELLVRAREDAIPCATGHEVPAGNSLKKLPLSGPLDEKHDGSNSVAFADNPTLEQRSLFNEFESENVYVRQS